MQAVAATMVFAAGMAIGTSSRGVAPTSSAGVTPAPAASGTTVGVSRNELAQLEERLRGELSRLSGAATPQTASVQTTPAQTALRVDDEAFMKRVRSLLAESEERQRGELALRTAQVMRDMEIQRKVDMATVQQDIDKIQGVTGAELKRQGELQNMLINRVGLQGR
jgi:predicted HicB family RNase H-like nuclease